MCVRESVRARARASLSVHARVFVCVCAYVRVCLCLYVRMRACMGVYVRVCVRSSVRVCARACRQRLSSLTLVEVEKPTMILRPKRHEWPRFDFVRAFTRLQAF
jgi:hypothetical protein